MSRQSAAGTCLLTSMTIDQVEDMEEALGKRVEEGWAFPAPLLDLRIAIEGEPVEIVDGNKEPA